METTTTKNDADSLRYSYLVDCRSRATNLKHNIIKWLWANGSTWEISLGHQSIHKELFIVLLRIVLTDLIDHHMHMRCVF